MSTDGLRYLVSFPAPHTHLVAVTMTVPVPANAEYVDLWMPAWCPGSYLIRDYARFVRDLTAQAGDSALPVTKLDKNTWRITCGAVASVEVRYQVYGHELTVRTNHIDSDHAFLHSPAIFLGGDAWRQLPVSVTVNMPNDWHVSTGMRQSDGSFTAANLDELYDMPLHLTAPGQGQRVEFTAAGVPFELELWGERAPGGAFSVERLVKDLTAIADAHAKRLGDVPFERYLFVVMFSHDSYGGLEHRNSSVNLHNTFALTTRKSYEGLLELLSHELFHAWNGKRIAPSALLRFDYGRESYTRCLWVMEGMTSHYDRFNLREAGVVTAKSYLGKVLDDWSRLMMVPGRRQQSLEASSFDAWIKLYRPDESNVNTTVSYYLKGGLVMFTLDLAIRRLTNGARSLDDVLRSLWHSYGANDEPHPEDVEALFAEATGVPMAEVFASQIRGLDDPDFAGELKHLGLELESSYEPSQLADGARASWLGITTTKHGRVATVLDGGPAHDAGISPGDELVAIDSLRATSQEDARALVAARAPGDVVNVSVFRRGRLVAAQVVLAESPPSRWELVALVADDAAKSRYRAVFGDEFPAPGPVATVSAASRWL